MRSPPVQRIHKQVLILVGISMVLVLGSFGVGLRASRMIRLNESAVQQLADNGASLERELLQSWEDASRDLARWENLEVADWDRRDPSDALNGIVDLLAAYPRELGAGDAELAQATDEPQRIVGTAQDLADRLAHWRTAQDGLALAKAQALAEIQAELDNMRELVARRQGETKLDAALLLSKLDRHAPDTTEVPLEALKALISEQAATGTLSADLAELAALSNQIAHASTIAQLEDLGHNRLRPALGRALSIGESLAQRSAQWARAPLLLRSLRTCWLGEEEGAGLADAGRGALTLQRETLTAATLGAAMDDEREAISAAWESAVRELAALRARVLSRRSIALHQRVGTIQSLSIAIGVVLAIGILLLGRAMARNIRKQVEAMEEMSNAMSVVNDRVIGLMAALEAAPDGILVVTPQGQEVWSNSALGRVRDAFGESVDDGPSELPEPLRVPSDLAAEGADLQSEFGVEMPGCARSVHRLRWTPIRSAGSIKQAVAIVRDVSSDRAREESLRRLDEEKELILGALDAILIGTDESGVVTSWNSAAAAVTMTEAGDVLGSPITAIAAVLGGDVFTHALARVLREGKAARLDHLQVRLPSSERQLMLALALNPILDKAGTLRGCLVLGRDVTEQHQLEAQLHQAQKLESIGQLAAGIAHEINTPSQFVCDNIGFVRDSFGSLAPILEQCRDFASGADAEVARRLRGLIAGADLEFLLEEVPKALEESLGGMKRVTTIVKAMKQFSHPGSGGFESADLNAAIESTVAVARNEWKYIADVEFDLDRALPPVDCLAGEINQVVLNMVVNSAHAIADVSKRKGGAKGTIRIATKCCGERARITISDTGGGIPPQIRHRIFDPFFTTKGVGKGTGQGLAIAHSVIVDRHHGAISVDSQVDVGTTFQIEIPLQQSSESARDAA